MSANESEFTLGIRRLLHDTSDPIVSNTLSFGQSPTFKAHRRQFEEFAVTGVSIRYIPGNAATSSQMVANTGVTSTNFISAGNLEPIQCWQDANSPDAFDLSETEAIQKDAYKIRDPRRGFKMYLSNKKLTAMAKLPWRPTMEPVYNEYTSTLRNYTHYFRFISTMPSTPPIVPFGWLSCVYYVRFRGLRYAGEI